MLNIDMENGINYLVTRVEVMYCLFKGAKTITDTV